MIRNALLAFALFALAGLVRADLVSVPGGKAYKTVSFAWCDLVTVTGTVGRSKVDHPNGSKFTIYFLDLNPAITIRGDNCDDATPESKSTEFTTKRVQVKEDDKVMAPHLGKTLSVTGELSSPAVAYDVLPVVIYPPAPAPAKPAPLPRR